MLMKRAAKCEKCGETGFHKSSCADFTKGDALDAIASAVATDAINDLPGEWKPMAKALSDTLKSVMQDSAVTDKPSAIIEVYKQLQDHLEKLETTTMPTLKEIAKALEDGVTEAISKMSSAHREVYGKLTGDVAKSFVFMDDGERAAFIAKTFPPKKPDAADDNDEDDAKKRQADLDKREAALAKREEEVRRAEIAKNDQLADLKKRLDVLTEKDQRAEFGKRALDLGLTEADGDMLLKAHRGDPEALTKMEEKIKALVAQTSTGDVFKEFGSRGNGGSAGTSGHDQLVAKAAEIRKADPKLTVEQAYVKAVEDPANREIVALEKRERDNRIFKMAS